MFRRVVYCSGGLYAVQGGYMLFRRVICCTGGLHTVQGVICCSGRLYGCSGELYTIQGGYIMLFRMVLWMFREVLCCSGGFYAVQGGYMMKKIRMVLVATNIVASRPPERRPTGTPTACTNFDSNLPNSIFFKNKCFNVKK